MSEKIISCSENGLFQLQQIDDLPPEMVDEIKMLALRRHKTTVTKLLSLFQLKNPLTLEEACVGFFRKFGIAKSMKWVSQALSSLKHQKVIYSEKNGKVIYYFFGEKPENKL